MGAKWSKITRTVSCRFPPSSSIELPLPRTASEPNFNTDSSEADLGAYEAACADDPDLRSFDSHLRDRTSQAIGSIAVGLEVRTLSLESLRQVTECFLEMNHDVVQIILQNKRDIWKNPELSDLVDDYFKNSLLTLDFCTTLDSCLRRSSILESIVNVAVQKFEEEHHSGEGDYSRTLLELGKFKDAGDPFTREFFGGLSSIHSRQISMLEQLQAKKRKLDRKLKKLKTWRKVSNVIFIVAFASVLICSVVAAAVAAPPVVTALVAAAAIPLGSVGRWLNSLWQKCEKDVEGQGEIISSMQIGSYIILKDLQNIKVLVERFRVRIEGLLANAELASNGDEAVVIAVEDIKKSMNEFTKTIRDLSMYANKCSEQTRMARTLILRRIINHPDGRSNQDIGMFS